MKRTKIACVVIISLFATVPFFSQENPTPGQTGLELVDDFGPIPCDDLLSRFDGFIGRLFQSKDKVGFVVITASADRPLRVLQLRPMIYNYFVETAGLDPDRFQVLRSGPSENWHVSFWLSPDFSVKPEISVPIYNFTLPVGIKPFLVFGPEGEMCPESSPNNSAEFTELLKANPRARGNIVIHAPTRSSYETEKKRIVDSLPGIATFRIRFFFVADKTLKEQWIWDEYWLVPKRKK